MKPTKAMLEAQFAAEGKGATSTTPTQAQIEAGEYDLKCTNGHDRCYMGTSDDCPYCERVAITAAAEVCPYCGERAVMGAFECRCTGVTAAAEVGKITVGDHKDLAMVENLRDEIARLKDERAATIERCAKACDELAYIETCADDTVQGTANAAPYRKAAARIRALKDKL